MDFRCIAAEMWQQDPASLVEPVSFPSPENPDAANKACQTRINETGEPLSLDFRGYGEQTWKPSGRETKWQRDQHCGEASQLWSDFIL